MHWVERLDVRHALFNPFFGCFIKYFVESIIMRLFIFVGEPKMAMNELKFTDSIPHSLGWSNCVFMKNMRSL
jgi:hypothetical protein